MRFLPIILFLLLAGTAAAEVLVFDKYETVSTVKDGMIHIEREMVLTNVARNPVIPGELHFKVYERDGDKQRSIKVSDFTAQNERGTTLGTRIVTKDDETDLSVTVWDPLLPGFSYIFRVQYDMHFEPSGLLFYELKIPEEETTIPIKGLKQTVLLDNKYHVTYAPQTDISKVSGNVVISWDDENEQQVIEYSALPFPRIPVRAVNVFWSVVIILLITVFVLTLRRRREAEPETPQGG